MLHREKIITELSQNYLSVRLCLAAYIMRRGKNNLFLFNSILLVWCSVKKRLEAAFFWKSDTCICSGGITTWSWFWSPFLIPCAEKKSDAIVFLKSWKQSKKNLRQYKCPTIPKPAGQYKTVHFYLQCLALDSIAFVPHYFDVTVFHVGRGLWC